MQSTALPFYLHSKHNIWLVKIKGEKAMFTRSLLLGLLVGAINLFSQSFTFYSIGNTTIPFGQQTVTVTFYFSYYNMGNTVAPHLTTKIDNQQPFPVPSGGSAHTPSSINITLGPGNHTIIFTLVSLDENANWMIHQQSTTQLLCKFFVKVKNIFEYGTIYVDNYTTAKNSPFFKEVESGQQFAVGAIDQDYGGINRKWNTSGNYQSTWDRERNENNIWIFVSSERNFSYTTSSEDFNKAVLRAGLRKNFRIDKTYTTEFDGNQSNPPAWIVEQNSGQISAPTQQTINGRIYNYAGWTDGNGDNPRTISNPTDNKTYTALYKMPQRSNFGVYNNNSQRKIVRSDDGKLHLTYESMGYVWYERSTNGGTTWQIMNGGKPIDSNPGKAPSIEVLYQPENYQSEIYIVYQTYTSSTYDVAAIKVAYFLETQLQYINTVYVDDYYYRDYTSVNFNPVVAKMLAGRIMVAWEDYNIYYKIGNQISGGFTWGSTTSADNASGEKKFPTIASYRANPNGVFHLAWQNSYSTINYRSFTLQSNGTFIASSLENVSQGCGYPTNYAPSINVSSGNQVSLVWIGTPYYGSTTRKTISRTRTTAWSSSFGQYGDKVLSPNSAFYNGGNIIAWSENPSGSTYTNKFLKYGSVKTAGTTGRDIQVFNANQLDQMIISSFNSNAIPYYFSQSANLNSINKENGTAMASGVQAVAIGGKTDFYFRVGDVSVNGGAIDFIEFEPQYGTLSLNQLNNALLTNPFALDGNSNINFSVEYGVTDSVSALNQLSNNKFITLKLELIDHLTKEVLKEVGKFTLDKKSLMTLLSNSYSYSISGLNGRQLSIRIKLVHNLNPLYASAIIKSDVAVLPKANLINLTSLAAELVTTYGLDQNYPNPFNPTTKINWQAPISGHQVLKVFDMLGNEVATLVDEWRDGGKYSYEFNATNLPSGVYVYQLKVNDFIASRKLMLLK
jgi:hypothetical protein